MKHKYVVGDIVLMKDGQYEAEVIELMPFTSPTDPPYYKLKDRDGIIFMEFEHYILDNE